MTRTGWVRYRRPRRLADAERDLRELLPSGRFAAVAAAVDTRRLLFGTDTTLIDPAAAYGAMLAANLSDEVAERVAWRNAADLFRLDLPGV